MNDYVSSQVLPPKGLGDSESNASALALAQLLDDHLDDVILSWARDIYNTASFHPEKQWMNILIESNRYAVSALAGALRSGSYDGLEVYLLDLCEQTIRTGFETSEVIGWLLQCKNAVMPVISRAYPTDTEPAFRLMAILDQYLSWLVQRFNALYSTEINRQLQEQHDRIISMLQMGEYPHEQLDLDHILKQIAERIISVLHVNHCDFYMTSEETNMLTPKIGISRVPHDHKRKELFLSYPPDGKEDPFYSDLIQNQKPVVRNDIFADPRINPDINIEMGTKSLLAVPLVTHGRVVAIAVTGTFNTYRAFTAEQVELAWDIARAAALVIENTQMYEKTRHMAVLQERERLAREIHDNLAQALSVVHLQASHIGTLLDTGDIEQAKSFLGQLREVLNEANVDARDAIISLRHGTTTIQEFKHTIRKYLERYQDNYGLETHLVASDEANVTLSAESIIQLTRIIQEALTNVRKHAAAKSVCVEFVETSNYLICRVRDDGKGFDPDQLQPDQYAHVGLQVMRERAESLGGRMEIETAADEGSCISFRIPLEN
ncbi:MAG: hypothetical protein CL607_01120 [Anaerolineaceae bacterium]|nr:hypothetical protein [Anaerolineaceae bacterium]